MGVIRSLKSHYRRLLLNSLVEAADKGLTYKPSIRDTIIITKRWHKVSIDTISNCFKKTGIINETTNKEPDIVEGQMPEEHLLDEMILNLVNIDFCSNNSSESDENNFTTRFRACIFT